MGRATWFFNGLALQTISARTTTGKNAFAKDPHLKKIYNLIFEDVPFCLNSRFTKYSWPPYKLHEFGIRIWTLSQNIIDLKYERRSPKVMKLSNEMSDNISGCSTWLVQGRSSYYVWVKQGYVEGCHKNILIRDGNEPMLTAQSIEDQEEWKRDKNVHSAIDDWRWIIAEHCTTRLNSLTRCATHICKGREGGVQLRNPSNEL